jgi:Flp pilus assembly protein TadG
MPFHRQRAQSSIEFALLIPGLLLGLFVLTSLGLVARADGEVADVAVEAARAGALVPTTAEVESAATLRAQAVATSYGMNVQRLQVAVDSSDFRRGGGVRVQVHYDLPLATLPLVGWGTVQLHHEAVEPVDRYRSLR